jgi:beta-mannosidase
MIFRTFAFHILDFMEYIKNFLCFFLSYFLFVFSSCHKEKQTSSAKFSLGGEWSFRSEESTLWFSATVPGCVHTDLLRNRMIPDPFFASNEDSVQWVAETTWEYRKLFDADELQERCKNIELVFEGIDTHASIFLNGTQLSAETPSGNSDNMFRPWFFDVSKILKNGDNELLVRFYPAMDYNANEAKKLNYTLSDERAFSRKAPYQFGWDWGAKLITCGLWKSVILLGWNDFKIENIQVVQKALSDKSAQMRIAVEVFSEKEGTVDLYLDIDRQTALFEQNVHLNKGGNIIFRDFEITNPERWNPNGLGTQKLYDVKVKLQSKKTLAQISDKIGLRTIELVREKDATGISFTFYVNGKAVFMKGANYIPQDNFLNRVTLCQHRDLLIAVKDANMNMLRVWGGGVYEDDDFYRLCDSLGILIWQDFMFACALYPGDSNFLLSVAKEAEYQVKRLRNHPCIALWCGNNEVKNGWDDWGWKNQYTKQEQDEIWLHNRMIFENILPKAVHKYDSGRAYHVSSPEWGWGHPQSITEGDSHYWGVWWGEEPFEVWDAKTGRFMSEYGFQSFPDYATIASFTLPDDRFFYSDAMKTHQKHPRGYEIIHNYMKRDYNVPDDFFNYVYVSQLLQARGIESAFESHRRKKPHCMGTLYWQLNDCWPVVSWSSLDSKLRRKALYYAARNAFQPVILSVAQEEEELICYVVSDLQHEIAGTITLRWENFTGQVMDSLIFKAMAVPANASKQFYRIPRAFFEEYFTTSMLTLHFDDQQGNIARKIYYFVPPKFLQLPDYQLNITVERRSNDYEIIIVGNGTLVKNLYLYTDPEIEGVLSDNFFDLLPNESKKLTFKPANTVNSESGFRKSLKTLSLKGVDQM